MIFVRLLFAACILCEAQVPEAGSKMDTLIDKALNSKGREYFEAERAYRLAGGSPRSRSRHPLTTWTRFRR